MALPDPSTLFPEAYTLGSALMDKVQPATPNTICLDKEDGEKYLLYVTTAMMKAIHTLASTVEAEIVGDRDIEGVNVTAAQRKAALSRDLQKPLLAIANVQHVCYQQARRYDGFYIDENICPITPPNTFTADDNVETVSDHALRNAGTFDGSRPDCPELLQSFLRSLNDIARTSRLSEACVVRLVQRRTLLTARTLVDSFLASIPDITQPGTLLKLVLFLEKNFSCSWRPAQAKASLAHLPQKYKNTKLYVQLQAKILQLSQLASLSEKEEDRPAFMKANQLPVFQACLTREDQDLLLRIEANRRSQALPVLNLATAVESLVEHHAARAVTTGDMPGRAESMVPQTSESAMMVQQGNRPRGRRGNSAPPRRYSEEPPRHPQETPRYLQEVPRYSEERRRSASRQGQRAPKMDNKVMGNRKQPLWEKYGVPRGQCLQCSGPHRINDPQCPYQNSGLPDNPCKYPGCKESGRGGGHWSSQCKTRAKVNAASQQQPHPPPPPPGGQSSRGRTSRGSGRRERSSRGGRSSAARRLTAPEPAMHANERIKDGEEEAFFFEE